MKNNRAFTLIELLVVIAIIAILAAIVLVSLSGAQRRANAARITAAMNQFRSQAQVIYSETNSYATATCTEATLLKVCNDVASMGSSVTVPAPTATQYCASAAIPGAPAASAYWCVDSNLNSVATSGVCAAATTVCK